jgi:hypothetical protein
MNGRRVRWFGAILLMTLIAVLVGVGAYRMGMAQGLALGMAQVEAGGRAAVQPYTWHAHGLYGYGSHGPWGFGFGFGFLVPLLFFFVLFAALRMLFWRGPRGPWRGGWGGPRHRHRQHRRWRDFDRFDDRRSFDDDDGDWRRRGTTL